jgi:hypothetical protein
MAMVVAAIIPEGGAPSLYRAKIEHEQPEHFAFSRMHQ